MYVTITNNSKKIHNGFATSSIKKFSVNWFCVFLNLFWLEYKSVGRRSFEIKFIFYPIFTIKIYKSHVTIRRSLFLNSLQNACHNSYPWAIISVCAHKRSKTERFRKPETFLASPVPLGMAKPKLACDINLKRKNWMQFSEMQATKECLQIRFWCYDDVSHQFVALNLLNQLTLSNLVQTYLTFQHNLAATASHSSQARAIYSPTLLNNFPFSPFSKFHSGGTSAATCRRRNFTPFNKFSPVSNRLCFALRESEVKYKSVTSEKKERKKSRKLLLKFSSSPPSTGWRQRRSKALF